MRFGWLTTGPDISINICDDILSSNNKISKTEFEMDTQWSGLGRLKIDKLLKYVFQVGEHTVEELKDINNQLYKFALKNILKT